MSDPARIKAGEAVYAAVQAHAEQVLKETLGICDCGNDHPRWEPRPMKVKDLHALLAEHIAHGRGDDDLYIYPSDDIEADTPSFMDVWGTRHNYHIVDFSWTDDADHFVTLTFDRTPEE